MSLFTLKKTGGPRDLDVSMAGVRIGSAVLQIGGRDGQLIAELAKVVGISGTACAAVASDDEAEGVRRAAARAGALVDIRVTGPDVLSYAPESFDVVVAPDVLGGLRMNTRVASLQQVLAVLRPNGRCVVIEPAPRGGLGSFFSQRALDPIYVANGGARAALEAEGFRGVRLLAEREGRRFFEGSK